MILTVGTAVETYIAMRDAREARRKGRAVRSDAGQRLGRYLIGQESRGNQRAIAAAPLADVSLHALKESDMLAWRAGLPEVMKATTRQRLVNDLKAALNAAYAANRDQLDPTLPVTIKHGLKASNDHGDDEATPLARDNQILSDAQVGQLIRAAQEIDAEQEWGGDLARLVIVLAATGARFSQIVRMKVDDVQRKQGRLIVPVSRKGRGGKAGGTPVPVGKDVLDVLLPVTTGRASDAPLLERWPWQAASEQQRAWQDIRERANMVDAIPYALRHSSIVRGIRANLPIRLAAALHDTSTPMIERQYGRWIADGLDELAARAVVPLVPAASGNVVEIGSAQR